MLLKRNIIKATAKTIKLRADIRALFNPPCYCKEKLEHKIKGKQQETITKLHMYI